MGQFHFDPDGYLALMHAEVPLYERVQDETAAATGVAADRVLELGIGTGETARRLLPRHPGARLVGLDESAAMLARARQVLPPDRVTLRVRRLQDPLPQGLFDLVVSALAVHHLDAGGKADLFRRVAARLAPGGRFVLADVVVPEDPSDVVTPIDGDHDTPSTVAEQLSWLVAAGLEPRLAWGHRDLAVLVAQATSGASPSQRR